MTALLNKVVITNRCQAWLPTTTPKDLPTFLFLKSDYRISSNTCPGVYFLPDSVDPELKRDPLLNGTGAYKPLVYTTGKFIDDVIDSMASEGSDSYEKRSVIRGHHLYKSVWTPFTGEELVVKAEDGNKHDEAEHAVSVMKAVSSGTSLARSPESHGSS